LSEVNDILSNHIDKTQDQATKLLP
jgi:hypothetical protein